MANHVPIGNSEVPTSNHAGPIALQGGVIAIIAAVIGILPTLFERSVPLGLVALALIVLMAAGLVFTLVWRIRGVSTLTWVFVVAVLGGTLGYLGSLKLGQLIAVDKTSPPSSSPSTTAPPTITPRPTPAPSPSPTMVTQPVLRVVTIDRPVDGQLVPKEVNAHGAVTGLPEGQTAWLIVQAGNGFYPQTSLGSNGPWTASVAFGGDADTGKTFTLHLVIADATADSKFADYLAKARANQNPPALIDGSTYPAVENIELVKVTRN